MIDNPSVAKEISDLMMDLFTKLSKSCETVRARCSEQEYNSYIKSTARIAGAIVMDVMEPLYEKQPHLKPPNWDIVRSVGEE
jgi:hypothetical protein